MTTTEKHPKDGVTSWFPKRGEAIVTAYGDAVTWGLRLYIEDAYRVIERDTGKRPTAHLNLRDDGAIEIRFGAGA
jgi:hypothetical protein